MSICATCSTENPDTSRFCFQCGSPLASGCPECGADLLPQAKFCPSCGARVQKETDEDQMLKPVSILFADVVSSTARSERMFAEETRDLMADFFAAMVEEIRAEGGRVEKFMGDAVMAVFGIPKAHEDDPVRAVRAARRMFARLETWNEGRDDLHRIQLRIGVNTGEVLAAAPGSDLEVTGDPVNVAARFEQSAEPGSILIGERTARVVRPYFKLQTLEPLALKGKSEPVPAYRVGEEREVPQDRGLLGLRAPLVGRERDLEGLSSLLEQVRDEGRAHLVTVTAEPGVGKSRLIEEFIGSIEAHTRVAIGRCLPYGEGVTLWPLAEILRAETGSLMSDPPDVALEKIVKFVRYQVPSELMPDRDKTVGALAATIGLSDALDPLKQLDPRERFRELKAAWVAVFSALAVERPAVVIVEDIHWADPTMLEVLEHVNRNVERPVLFVCPTRPELFATRPTWGTTERSSSVTLQALSQELASQLIENLLGEAGLPSEVREEILARSEGNPFFIEEILQRLIDEGLLKKRGERWQAEPGIESVPIPDNVQGVILARIDLLSPSTRKALQHASVVGRHFWVGSLAVVEEADDIEAILDDLEEHELIHRMAASSMAGDVEYAFKHILIRDVAYETLPRKRRGRAHAAVARWVENISPERVLELAELIAHHFHQAFTYTKDDEHRLAARSYYGDAAHNACTRFAIRQAEVFGYLVVDLSNPGGERIEALEGLGDIYCLTAGMDGAWKAYSDALRDIPEDDPASVARLAAKAAVIPTRHENAMSVSVPKEEIESLIKTGLKASEADGDSSRAWLLASRAFMQRLDYGEETDDDYAEQALQLAESLGEPDLISAALDAKITPLLAQGRYGEIDRLNQRRLDLIPQLTDLKEICDTYLVAGWVCLLRGKYGDAVRFSTACIDRARGADPGAYLDGLVDRVPSRFLTGDWVGALEDQAEIERLEAEQSRDTPPIYTWIAYSTAAQCRYQRGESEAADRYFSLLYRLMEPEDRVEGPPTWSAALYARALLLRGDTERALSLLDLRTSPVLASHLETLSLILTTDPKLPMDDQVFDIGRIEAERGEHLALPLFLDRLEGRISQAAGELLDAESALRRSADGFADLPAPWEEALSRLLLAETLASSGKSEDALQQAERARTMFAHLGSIQEERRSARLIESLR